MYTIYFIGQPYGKFESLVVAQKFLENKGYKPVNASDYLFQISAPKGSRLKHFRCRIEEIQKIGNRRGIPSRKK